MLGFSIAIWLPCANFWVVCNSTQTCSYKYNFKTCRIKERNLFCLAFQHVPQRQRWWNNLTCVVINPASAILAVKPDLERFDNFSVRQRKHSGHSVNIGPLWRWIHIQRLSKRMRQKTQSNRIKKCCHRRTLLACPRLKLVTVTTSRLTRGVKAGTKSPRANFETQKSATKFYPRIFQGDG